MRIPAPFPALAIAIPLIFLSTLTGCVGGGERRDPRGEVVLDKSHWVFPLYHYQEREGRRTLRPFFLIPITLSDNEEYAATEDNLAPADSSPLAGSEDPAWGRSTESEDPRSGGAVEPGVWGSSVPQRESESAVGGSLTTNREHEVRPGDTFYAIAKLYYGSGASWQTIADANRDRVANPESLAVGVRLRIPGLLGGSGQQAASY
jgi:hypothetical protein